MSTASQAQPNPYAPEASLVPGLAGSACRACVAIPVRNEEQSLPACLDALAGQVDANGLPLSQASFEILLLLNNCTDESAAVVRHWHTLHPGVALHLAERAFPAAVAHAGTARKLLMDTALQRLGGLRLAPSALLCTDADSAVAPDWILQNLRALGRGAGAVGGKIELQAEDLRAMPELVRRCYERDREYGELAAHLEDLLDPQPGDAWPRHQHHFGSSLACTPQAYLAAGGMPDVATLEDEAFVHRLRRAGLSLRHDPLVRIFTSARLDGRAKVGLASQLRSWSELPDEGAHRVQSAAFLSHRFTALRGLRTAFAERSLTGVRFPTQEWRLWARTCLREQESLPDFLAAIDANGLIENTFAGEREQPISDAIQTMQAALAAYEA